MHRSGGRRVKRKQMNGYADTGGKERDWCWVGLSVALRQLGGRRGRLSALGLGGMIREPHVHSAPPINPTCSGYTPYTLATHDSPSHGPP